MNMEIKLCDKTYEIGFEPIMQFCGQNILLKNSILEIIKKYFSSSKYSDYEENIKCNIYIEGNEYGRKAFQIYNISGKNDLISEIKITKNSLLSFYIKNLINKFDCQVYINKIDDELTEIFNIVNDKMKEIGKLSLSYAISDIWEMIQKTEILGATEDEFIENKSAVELIEIYLNLLEKSMVYEPNRSLVIFENIDHMISVNDYKKIISVANKMTIDYDIHFIFSTSIDGYCIIDYGNEMGINVFNIMIYALPEWDRLKAFIYENYPYEKDLSDDEIRKGVEAIIHKIGKVNSLTEIQDIIFLKLINKSLAINESLENKTFMPELCFLNSANMI